MKSYIRKHFLIYLYQLFYIQASDRAKLGLKATRLLKRGRAVDDQLTVDIIIEAIKYVHL